MTDTFDQGPVRSLRDGDQIVIRQSNGREMFLPIGVLVDYVAAAIANAIGVAHIPVDRVDGLHGVIEGAITSAHIPAERVDGLATVATTGDYKDLHGKPGDTPGGG